ncbi:hypothetical protein D3C75_849210 [compost metagenome]
MQGVAPGCQIVPACATGAFRVWGDHGYARLHQIIPVVDLFRVAFTHQENDGGGVRCGVVRQAFNPVLIDASAFRDGIHVVSQRQGHDIGFDTVNDRRCLLTGTAVRLADHHVVAGFLFPVRRERFVVLIVQFTCRIVRHVQ